MENINQILERQHAYIKFKDGKVNYFSVSTQHGTADTIDEAIEDIIELDKKYNGKSSIVYAIEKYENSLPDKIDMKMDLSHLDLDKVGKLYADFLKKTFGCE